jgi:hypothetical protein
VNAVRKTRGVDAINDLYPGVLNFAAAHAWRCRTLFGHKHELAVLIVASITCLGSTRSNPENGRVVQIFTWVCGETAGTQTVIQLSVIILLILLERSFVVC